MSVPAQERIGSDDRRDVLQRLAPQQLTFDGQAAALQRLTADGALGDEAVPAAAEEAILLDEALSSGRHGALLPVVFYTETTKLEGGPTV